MARLQLMKIRQRFDHTCIPDVRASLDEQLSRLDALIRPGSRIAIAAGSRGIDNLASIVSGLAAYLRSRGADPFVVPAMGSHGGATAAGQAEVLREYGIFERAIGASVRATMDVVELPRGGLPIAIFMDRYAHDADGVILVNRIKPHTDFHGTYESGLMKMALIGLGKLEGAQAVHAFGLRGLRELIAPGARQVISSGKILAGIGLVENALHQTVQLRVLKADEIACEEPVMLDLARRHMPRLPIGAVDVLLVDRMGKNISGVGIDPNVTGRIGVHGAHDAGAPVVAAIVVCDLTDESRGNGIGIGLADVITERLHAKVDRAATYANVITSGFLERGKTPIVAESPQAAFDIALRSSACVPQERARVLRILDTLNLEELYVSPAVADELRSEVDVIGGVTEMFNERGELIKF